jgi:threonine dehydrogenase-like Zn-dependent dehydrogenase
MGGPFYYSVASQVFNWLSTGGAAREFKIITSYSSTPFTLRRALAILERDDYALEQLVDPVLKLDQAALGFELAYQAQASKVAIVP